MNETQNTIEAFITEDGTVYTPCETSEAEGLWNNGKFIEGTFIEGKFFLDSLPWFYPADGRNASCIWKMLGAIPVKKVVPEPPAPELVGPKDGGLER
jgi:hypothetical protein